MYKLNEYRTDDAKTIFIHTKETSFATIAYNEVGDLMIHSDWGMFAHSWRSFGDGKFSDWLGCCDTDYIFSCLASNYNRERPNNDYLSGKREQVLRGVVEIFLDTLNKGQHTTPNCAASTILYDIIDKTNKLFVGGVGSPYLKEGENTMDKLFELATEMCLIGGPAKRLKRYLVFCGFLYYPNGGMEDFSDDFDSLEEAMAHAKEKEAEKDWAYVYDQEKKELIIE